MHECCCKPIADESACFFCFSNALRVQFPQFLSKSRDDANNFVRNRGKSPECMKGLTLVQSLFVGYESARALYNYRKFDS